MEAVNALYSKIEYVNDIW